MICTTHKRALEIGTIVAHYNNYGYVVEVRGDRALVLYPHEAPGLHKENTEIENLKRNPEYGHLLTEENRGSKNSLVVENIRRHLKKHFPKGQFRIARLSSSEAIEVTWRNTPKCRIDQNQLEILLMPFLWGTTDDDGSYIHVRNPFATVFGGVFHIEFCAPRHVD